MKRIVEGDFSAQFAFSLALKDVDLALEAVGRERFRALTCLADEWLEVVDRGLGNSDLTVVARALEQKGKAITPARCRQTSAGVPLQMMGPIVLA